MKIPDKTQGIYEMRIKDLAIIIGKKSLQEQSAIVHFFTKEHGIYSAFVKNISGKNAHIYQIGNIVDFFWNSRLDEKMGTARCELMFSSPYFMQSKIKLYALSSLVTMLLSSFQERIPHKGFFKLLENYIRSSDRGFSFMDYAYMEGKILEESGYGLDLRSCAATGCIDNLIYVSPKSARAISADAGEPYKDKLLKLPSCALTGHNPTTIEELNELSDLLLYFFQRYIFRGKEPEARKLFLSAARANIVKKDLNIVS